MPMESTGRGGRRVGEGRRGASRSFAEIGTHLLRVLEKGGNAHQTGEIELGQRYDFFG